MGPLMVLFITVVSLLWHYTIVVFSKTIYRLPGEHVDVAASLQLHSLCVEGGGRKQDCFALITFAGLFNASLRMTAP